MAETAQQIVEQNIGAFSQGDWERFGATVSDDGVYEEPATQRRVTTRDETLAIAQGWKRGFPDGRGTIRNIFASDNRVVAEVTWEGTHQGELVTPTGDTIPPTGNRMQLPATIVARVEDGRIKESHHYFDLLSLLGQLGVAQRMAA